jgi:phosphoribosylformylglycinamidine synthase
MADGSYTVEVIVGNKPSARDPEGETIHHNLILKGGYTSVTNVRAAKLLQVTIKAQSSAEATRVVRKLCDDLRIYNPASHSCQVRLVE